MKVFYCANLDKLKNQYWKDRYIAIHKFLKSSGVNLVSNLEKKILMGDKDARKSISYDQIEAVIIEGSKIASDTVYIIATALAYKKPVLYLIEKGSQVPDQLSYIRKDKNLGENFYLKYYLESSKTNNFGYIILNFLNLLESGEIFKEKYDVKFTLRISSKIERYLNWFCKKEKICKADYLRGILNQKIEEDKKYKSFLRKI
ncbi:hypothetical protein K8R66_04630 [bacterium]|nr:hypothetical protein [bacterium]